MTPAELLPKSRCKLWTGFELGELFQVLEQGHDTLDMTLVFISCKDLSGTWTYKGDHVDLGCVSGDEQ